MQNVMPTFVPKSNQNCRKFCCTYKRAFCKSGRMLCELHRELACRRENDGVRRARISLVWAIEISALSLVIADFLNERQLKSVALRARAIGKFSAHKTYEKCGAFAGASRRTARNIARSLHNVRNHVLLYNCRLSVLILHCVFEKFAA